MKDAVNSDLGWIQSWLCDAVLPYWWSVGRDAETGGFFEALDFDGRPRTAINRRGRVTPRQLYAFSLARTFGLFDPSDFLETMERGCTYLMNTVRLEDGRFAGMIGPDGGSVLSPAVLYDLAFIALAGAELSKFGVKGSDALAKAAFAQIDTRFKDPLHGGYWATEEDRVKLANPHMHLLEACICAFDARGGQTAGDRMTDILNLFETHFFDPDTGAVHEKRNRDFSASDENWTEPGHGLEWAFLIHEANGRLGRQSGDEMATRLMQSAEDTAIMTNGLTIIPNRIEGDIVTRSARLWPQLERLRAVYTLDPNRDLSPILRTIRTAYLEKGPRCGWVDALDEAGEPIAPHIPASMLYHLMTAFGPLLAARS